MAQLPLELIAIIFGYLLLNLNSTPNHGVTGELNLDRSATLLKFAMTCRTFYQLAMPHVYYKFGCVHGGLIGPLDVLECFMTSPNQALVIHELYTGMATNERRRQHYDDARWDHHCRSGPSLQLCKLLLSLDISDELRDDLYGGLQDGFDDAETAMLLCLCKDLRVWETRVGGRSPKELLMHHRLNGDDGGTFCDSLENKVIREARVPGSHLLQSLEEVRVQFDARVYDDEPSNYREGTHYWALRNVKDTLMLRSLRRLTIEGFAIHPLDRDDLDFSLRSMVEHLCLRESWLEEVGLRLLLKRCPRLKTLSVHRHELNPIEIEQFYDNPITYPRLGHILRRYGTKLTKLEWKESSYDLRHSLIGDLTRLTSLETLSLPLAALLKDYTKQHPRLRKILPTSLTSLTITSAGTDETDEAGDGSRSWDRTGLDVTLPKLMTDERYSKLSTIKTTHFSRVDDKLWLHELGWKHTSIEQDETDLFVVLKRFRRPSEVVPYLDWW